MGAFGTNDRMIGISQSLQTQAISRCAIENEEHFNIFAQLFLKEALRRVRICVIPVSDYMALIGRADRLKDIGVDAGIIVTSKTTSCFHEFNNLADEQKVGGATLFFELMTSNQRLLDNANYVTLWLHILLEVGPVAIGRNRANEDLKPARSAIKVGGKQCEYQGNRFDSADLQSLDGLGSLHNQFLELLLLTFHPIST
jgi:hypothetical protein